MALKKNISKGGVSSVHKKNLPVHKSDAKATEPKKSENKKMEVAATEKAKANLPTHSSDAKSTDPAGEFKKKVLMKVDPELDGQKIAKDMADGVDKTLTGKDGATKKNTDLASVKEGKEDKDSNKELELDEDDDDKDDDDLNEEEEKEEEEEEEEEEEDAEEAKEKMKEHVEALISGENLSEEFKIKAETIFEAAVNERVANIQRLHERKYSKELASATKVIHEELAEQVDTYLNYVTENYMKENALAIEEGIHQEISESFLTGLKDIFEKHNIEIPQEEYNIVEDLQENVTNLETNLNDSLISNKNLKQQISEMEKEVCLRNACDSLSDTESEKLRSLSEGLEFDDVESYENKIEVIKESYFDKSILTKDIDDSSLVDGKLPDDSKVSGVMESYLQAVRRSMK